MNIQQRQAYRAAVNFFEDLAWLRSFHLPDSQICEYLEIPTQKALDKRIWRATRTIERWGPMMRQEVDA